MGAKVLQTNRNKIWALVGIFVFISTGLANAQNIGLAKKEIKGQTGGNVNSGDCGYIASQPNHVINLTQAVYSLEIRLEATQGNPSLLILGPGSNDRFCILGEQNMNKSPRMSGVWDAGKYSIYVGDIQGNQHPFTLRIINNE